MSRGYPARRNKTRTETRRERGFSVLSPLLAIYTLTSQTIILYVAPCCLHIHGRRGLVHCGNRFCLPRRTPRNPARTARPLHLPSLSRTRPPGRRARVHRGLTLRLVRRPSSHTCAAASWSRMAFARDAGVLQQSAPYDCLAGAEEMHIVSSPAQLRK